MKYDDASWHYGGDFDAALPNEAGATHIAMFVAWAVLNDLAGDFHTPGDLTPLRSRTISPAQWFLNACDEKFTDEDLNEEGNAFARTYYGDGTGLHSDTGTYLDDYCSAFPDLTTLYAVPDGWASFDKLTPTLSKRLAEWRAKSLPPAS